MKEKIAMHLALVDGKEWEYLPTATKEGYREIADEILSLLKEEIKKNLLTDEELIDKLNKFEWRVIEHTRQYERRGTKIKAHSLYHNGKMVGYVIEELSEKQDYYPSYMGDREYASSWKTGKTLKEAKDKLLKEFKDNLRCPLQSLEVAQAQLDTILKMVEEG